MSSTDAPFKFTGDSLIVGDTTIPVESWEFIPADRDDLDEILDAGEPSPKLPGKPPKGFRKVGKNEKCPCGSGVKFKTCCAWRYKP